MPISRRVGRCGKERLPHKCQNEYSPGRRARSAAATMRESEASIQGIVQNRTPIGNETPRTRCACAEKIGASIRKNYVVRRAPRISRALLPAVAGPMED